MKFRQQVQPELAMDVHALWKKVGSTLLRFAGEDCSLDRDALYQRWAESDSRCWVDTEQQSRSAGVQGLPPGATPLVSEPETDAPPTVQPDFAESTGYGHDLSSFQSEIDAWRDSRHPPLESGSASPGSPAGRRTASVAVGGGA